MITFNGLTLQLMEWAERLGVNPRTIRSRIRRGLPLLLVLLVLWPALGAAQHVVNPTTVEFTASADHAAVLADGQAAVTRYQLEIYVKGATSPMSTTDLAKPTPDGANKIRATPAVLVGVPVGQTYVCRVTAIGPLGEGRSDPSNEWSRGLAPRAPANVAAIR